MYYKGSASKEAKGYMLLTARSLTTAIHHQALQDLSTDELIRSLKLFIARQRCPEKLYSDNAKTFEACG